MPTSRCPIVRLQSGWAGAQGFTTDYHSWPKAGGPCAFCSVSRRDANVGAEARPTRLGWEGVEVDRVRREWEQILVARPPASLLPNSPFLHRWVSVTSLLTPPQRSLI